MTLIPGKWCIQECIHDLQSKSRSYYTTAHGQNVGIVMKSCCFCSKAICTKCSTDSLEFISSDRNSDTCSADQDSFLTLTVHDRLCYFLSINRIVYRFRTIASKIFVLQPSLFQMLLYLLHQLIAAMITSQCYHFLSPPQR